MVRGVGRSGAYRSGAIHSHGDHNPRQPVLPVPGIAWDTNPIRFGSRPNTDPVEGDTPLRHVARGPSAVGVGDQDQLRRAEIAGPARKLPRLRFGPRFTHVGLIKPRWQHAVPRGGPEMGPERTQGRAGPTGPHSPIPNPAPPGPHAPFLGPLRAHVLPFASLPTWQQGLQARTR